MEYWRSREHLWLWRTSSPYIMWSKNTSSGWLRAWRSAVYRLASSLYSFAPSFSILQYTSLYLWALAWSSPSQWPQLALMAYDFPAIPAISSECKRVFLSCAKQTTLESSRLSGLMLAYQECLKNWHRRGAICMGTAWNSALLDLWIDVYIPPLTANL
jgi:hypothetical protein